MALLRRAVKGSPLVERRAVKGSPLIERRAVKGSSLAVRSSKVSQMRMKMQPPGCCSQQVEANRIC